MIPLALAAFLGFFHFFKFSQTWTAKGIKLLKEKNPQSAAGLFVKILERDPFHPYAHLNLGLAYDMSDRPMKALKEYGIILKHFDQDSLQFYSSFNTAELHGRLGSLEKALENYQWALSFSMEPERIKQNIELLFKASPPQAGQGKPQNSDSKSGSQAGDGQKNQEEPMAEQQGPSSSNENDPNSQDSEAKGGAEGDQPEDQQLSQGSLSDSEQGQPQSGGSSSRGEISQSQAQSIMDEIEEQESNVRARQFQQNSSRRSRRNTTHKDW